MEPVTTVVELKTVDDVRRFCSSLLEQKKKAPVSLHLMIAVTATRNSIVRETLLDNVERIPKGVVPIL